MNCRWRRSPSVAVVEAIILDMFRREPFHNLHLLSRTKLTSLKQGGTCSDKTLSFLSEVRKVGVDASLHTGFIDGKEIHRLAQVRLDGSVFFADVGNGWPALRLYPADRRTNYSCYGMRFRTIVNDQRLTVFHKKQGKESCQLAIDIHGKPESEIRADIANRFSSGVIYPFTNSIRFSMIVDDRFLFLRGDRLEIYSDTGFTVVSGIAKSQVSSVILRYFRYDIRSLLPPEVSIRLEGGK